MNKTIAFKKMPIYLVMAITFLTFSCSGENDDEQDDNKISDVAVTSNVTEFGATYAYIDGYVNLNLITSAYDKQTLGVELSLFEDFNKSWRVESKDLVKNKVTVKLDTLSAQTKYYYRTFVNVNGLNYYGEKKSFTTLDFSNITTTGNVSDLTLTSVILNCKAEPKPFDIKNNFKIGIVYSTQKSIIHSDSLFKFSSKFTKVTYPIDSIKNNSYKVSISNLQVGTTYYYSSFTKAGSKYKLGEVKSFSTISLSHSVLGTGDASYVTLNSAKIINNSTLSEIYPKANISYGLRYSTVKDDLINNVNSHNINSIINGNSFTVEINNLAPDTTYYYYAYATVDGTRINGEVKEFRTKSVSSYLSIEDTNDVTITSAKLYGNSTLETLYNMGENITYEIRYSMSETYLCSKDSNYNRYYNTVTPTKADKRLHAYLNNLQQNTTYFYCIAACIDGIYIFSDINKITTKDIASYLTTENALNVSFTSAELNARSLLKNLYADTNEEIKYKFRYSTNKNYLSNENNIYDSQYITIDANISGEKLFTNINNLFSNTKYYFCIVAYIDGCYIIGDIKEFTTQSVITGEDKTIFTPSEMGYSNAQDMTTITLSDGTTLTFDAGGNQNSPKYYNTGKGIRIYPKNSMKVTSSKKISSIIMTVDEYLGITYNASGDLKAEPGSVSTADNTVTFSGINNAECTITNVSTKTGAPSQLRMTKLTIVYSEK